MDKKLNIILIAYYFEPDRRVGALRASYWYRNLPLHTTCNLHVVTANKESVGKNIHYVSPTGKSILSNFIKDPGLMWIEPLQSFLIEHLELKPDVILITGGPFMHFGITPWLKRKFNCKVILDYRDPFAINPGFNNSAIQIYIKSYFEGRFNKHADALITVNKHCAEIIAHFNTKKNAIIQNGYDETVSIHFEQPKLGANMTMVYTGKFYFSPNNLIAALSQTSHVLEYYGADGAQLNHEKAKDCGLVPYEAALSAIATGDIGVIQTYGEDFQSTTKLFDYIRLERPILIISANHLHRGSIHDELQGYPNVFWCKNDIDSIKEQLKLIENHNYEKPKSDFSMKFSRGKQVEKLIRLIQDV